MAIVASSRDAMQHTLRCMPQRTITRWHPKAGPHARRAAILLRVLAWLLVGASCDTVNRGTVREATAEASAVTSGWFPPDALRGHDEAGLAQRFVSILGTMGEPGLAALGPSDSTRVLRLLWVRTFHRPMAVRLVMDGGTCRVVLTVLSGKGGTDPGTVQRRDSSTTARARCDEVERTLRAAGFWSDSLEQSRRAANGAEWVFEARGTDGHRVVTRWSPEASRRDPRFALAGRAFLRLASWDEAADDPIY